MSKIYEALEQMIEEKKKILQGLRDEFDRQDANHANLYHQLVRDISSCAAELETLLNLRENLLKREKEET